MKRTLVAAVLTLAAIAAPAAGWWWHGHRETQRAREHAEARTRTQLDSMARLLARQLGDRLEALRRTEALRPFYHYRASYHDAFAPEGSPTVVSSPLADGPEDPLVRCHFLIDPDGTLTVPSTGSEEHAADLAQHAAKLIGLAAPPPDRPEKPVYSRGPRAWMQSLAQRLRRAPTGDVEGSARVGVGPLRWHELPADRGPKLVALRYLETPMGTFTQGLAIDEVAALESVSTPRHDLQLRSGRPAVTGEAALPLAGVEWKLGVDPAIVQSAAAREVDRQRREFRRTFWLVLAVATIAGAGVIGLAWHADRLARQRAAMAAVIAHELRTPLTGLRLHAELLGDGLGDPERLRTYARRVSTEVDRLTRVVHGVLGFTRAERGTLRATLADGDIGEHVLRSAERLVPLVEAAGRRLEVSVAPELPAVRFDEEAVSAIVVNLVDNAIKHAGEPDDPCIEVSVTANGESVLLAVQDHGDGLPSNLRGGAFAFFKRGDARGAPPGLGLGLALSAELARAHGGELSAHDVPGGGARFEVSLPTALNE